MAPKSSNSKITKIKIFFARVQRPTNFDKKFQM
jgi:hypothetical protein